jgi:hypothetical protein
MPNGVLPSKICEKEVSSNEPFTYDPHHDLDSDVYVLWFMVEGSLPWSKHGSDIVEKRKLIPSRSDINLIELLESTQKSAGMLRLLE